MKRQASLIVLMTFLLLIFPSSFLISMFRADVAIVPGGIIHNYQMLINLTLDDNDVWVDIQNNFTLENTDWTDTQFSTNIVSPSDSLIYGKVQTPQNVSFYLDESSFNIEYNRIREYDFLDVFFYNFTLYYENISGLDIHRFIRTAGFYDIWTDYYLSVKDFTVKVISNVNVTINGNETGRSHIISFPQFDIYPHDYMGNHLRIQWSEEHHNETIFEWMDCAITPEHVAHIENLIKHESVEIETILVESQVFYKLNASFILNKAVIVNQSPVHLWFPENGTHASVNITFIHTEHHHDDTGCQERNLSKSISCFTERSMRYNQKGFYITIPDLYEYGIINDPILEVCINGTLENDCFDFVIVTIPQEESSIRFHLPSRFEVHYVDSPFETFFKNTTKFHTNLTFGGMCTRLGPLHLEWIILPDIDEDHVPDTIDDFPNDPSKWEKEKERKDCENGEDCGFLPGFEVITMIGVIGFIPFFLRKRNNRKRKKKELSAGKT